MVLPPAVMFEVFVAPNVADGNVASQQHSYATNASLLHIDVLVVVSIMAPADG